MSMTVRVDVVSAEKEIYSGLAKLVTATGNYGELGVTPGHAPLLTSLKPGEVRLIKDNDEEEVFYISGGMLEVQPHHVTVLADEAERADNLDEAAAEKARERAKEALEKREGDFDYSKAAAELARAAAQIAAIRKVRKKKH